jgi:uncharacterized membrane protein
MLRTIRWRQTIGFLAITAILTWGASAVAGKPGGKPDKGGGGSGPSYEIIALDEAGGILLANANDISNSGLIVGSAYDPVLDELFAACWTIDETGGAITSTLHLLPGGGAVYGVNELGEMVGGGPNDFDVARYWQSSNTTPLPLPPLPGDTYSIAEGISNDGIVCGVSFGRVGFGSSAVAWRVNIEIVDGEPTPVVWGPLELPTLVSATEGPNTNSGNAITDAEGFSIIAGDSGLASVAWTVESLADGTLAFGRSQILDIDGKGRGVNEAGTVCGTSFSLSASGWEAVVWSDQTQVLARDKFVLSAHAHDMNGNGVVVGVGSYHRKFEQGERAVVWSNASASMVLLDKFLSGDSPFAHLETATAVNDAGLIVGCGNNGAFVAIPE